MTLNKVSPRPKWWFVLPRATRVHPTSLGLRVYLHHWRTRSVKFKITSTPWFDLISWLCRKLFKRRTFDWVSSNLLNFLSRSLENTFGWGFVMKKRITRTLQDGTIYVPQIISLWLKNSRIPMAGCVSREKRSGRIRELCNRMLNMFTHHVPCNDTISQQITYRLACSSKDVIFQDRLLKLPSRSKKMHSVEGP